MGHIDPDQWQGALGHLRALQADGLLSTSDIRAVADGYGVTERTIRRRLSTAPPPGGDPIPTRQGPSPYVLTQPDLLAYILYTGNVAFIHRARTGVLDGTYTAAGFPIPQVLIDGWHDTRPVSLRTLQRAFATQLSSGMRAGMTEGEAGRRRHSLYLQRDQVPRNQVWEMDHKRLSIMVRPRRGPATNPWLTSIVDCGTRYLVGWCLALRPTQETVLLALRMGLAHDPARGPTGAVPRLVRVDRGLEFAAESVRAALGSLAVRRDRLPGYEPYLKGKIERVHRTVEDSFSKGQPGHTKGPRDKAGRLLGPLADDPKSRAGVHQAQVQPLTLEEFTYWFKKWVNWYNTEKPHSMLKGKATALQAWEADPFTLYRIPTETLRHLLMATKPYVIGKDGINFKSRKYCHSKLNGHGGERVVLRHIPDDPDFVEVYLRGEHLCTAYPREQLSKEQEDAIIDARRTDEAELKHLVGEARKASTEQLILAGDVANAQQATSTGPPADASGEVSVEAPPPAADSAADQAGDQGRVRGTRRAPRHQAAPAPAPARAAREQRNLLTSYNLLGLVDPFDDPDLDPDSYGQEPVDLSGYHQPDEGPAPGPR